MPLHNEVRVMYDDKLLRAGGQSGGVPFSDAYFDASNTDPNYPLNNILDDVARHYWRSTGEYSRIRGVVEAGGNCVGIANTNADQIAITIATYDLEGDREPVDDIIVEPDDSGGILFDSSGQPWWPDDSSQTVYTYFLDLLNEPLWDNTIFLNYSDLGITGTHYIYIYLKAQRDPSPLYAGVLRCGNSVGWGKAIAEQLEVGGEYLSQVTPMHGGGILTEDIKPAFLKKFDIVFTADTDETEVNLYEGNSFVNLHGLLKKGRGPRFLSIRDVRRVAPSEFTGIGTSRWETIPGFPNDVDEVYYTGCLWCMFGRPLDFPTAAFSHRVAFPSLAFVEVP